MSDFLGSRISLISKSDIRYVGTLVEINSAESTVSLQNVHSHGSEGRKNDPEEEVPASAQIYDFIVFRGSDVKDLRIEEAPAPPKENHPPMPNDPAIVGARPQGRGGPQGPPGAPGFQNPGMFPPYPPQGWGRPGPPGPPGPGQFGGMGYPPQGWYPQQGFPPNAAPGPWNYPYPGGPQGGPVGPPGMPQQQQPPRGQAPLVSPNNGGAAQPDRKPTPIGPGADKSKVQAPGDMPPNPQAFSQPPIHPAAAAAAAGPAPTPPVESKPSVEEVKVAAALLETQKVGGPSNDHKQIPTGPRGLTQITPAVPLPTALTGRNSQELSTAKPAATGSLQEAAAQARAAVAAAAMASAIAKLEGTPAAPVNNNQTANAPVMDNLTRRLNDMTVNAARSGFRPRGGRGRGGHHPRADAARVEVPASDFDFASANAKFNKDEVVKEKIAGTTATDTPTGASGEPEQTASGDAAQAYNKKKSFFDNISNGANERKETNGPDWRGQEKDKNLETFGQASVDGGRRGYRGRGRGRGRGYGGRGWGSRGSQPVPQ